jgi:hypothetical protein
MNEPIAEQELKDRLQLIESMIAAGRRKTENSGWTFVLWGVAYYIAFAWSAWGNSVWAWPVTVSVAVILTLIVASIRKRKSDHPPETNLGRAVVSVWIALGISIFLLLMALGFSGRLADQHLFMAIIAAMLGFANGASAIILRWKHQLACAVVWWATAAIVCFGTVRQSTAVFLAAIFVCQIVFGIYGMAANAQQRKRRGPVHA